jgi:large subunit ribosomal protein L4
MADAKINAPYLGKTGTVALDAAVFGEPFNGSLVHEVVRAERNALRSGNASTKTRGQIAMTGAKAWRQKGTGRARVGALSAGHRRGGGVTFGPTPRNYTFKVNRKARRKAFRAALSLHAERGTLAIVPKAAFSEPSTGDAADNLSAWKDNGSIVVITAGADDVNTAKSFRNIGRVRAVLPPSGIGVYELTTAQNVVISEEALDAITALASTDIDRASKKPVVAAAAGKKFKHQVRAAGPSAPNQRATRAGKATGAAPAKTTEEAAPEAAEEATE